VTDGVIRLSTVTTGFIENDDIRRGVARFDPNACAFSPDLSPNEAGCSPFLGLDSPLNDELKSMVSNSHLLSHNSSGSTLRLGEEFHMLALFRNEDDAPFIDSPGK
jgi:hypothetical protein